MPDAHANFAVSLVATAPSPATSGTSLVVTAGQGTRFPAVPFNATICPAGTLPDPSNAEIVRVTARSTDTLTITRAQESSSARTVVVGDQIAATVTAKTLTDVETNVDNTAPSTQAFGDAAASGVSAIFARRDHVHAMPALGTIGGAIWTTVRKPSDESISSSTVSQADDHLLFTAAAGITYEIEVVLIITSAGTTGNIKVGFGEDATVRGTMDGFGLNTSGSGIQQVFSTNKSQAPFLATSAKTVSILVVGSHVGAGGTFGVHWCQNASDSNATTVKAGSVIRYRAIV